MTCVQMKNKFASVTAPQPATRVLLDRTDCHHDGRRDRLFGLSVSAVDRTMKLPKMPAPRAEHQLALDEARATIRSDVHAADDFHSITENSTIRLEMKSDNRQRYL